MNTRSCRVRATTAPSRTTSTGPSTRTSTIRDCTAATVLRPARDRLAACSNHGPTGFTPCPRCRPRVRSPGLWRRERHRVIAGARHVDDAGELAEHFAGTLDHRTGHHAARHLGAARAADHDRDPVLRRRRGVPLPLSTGRDSDGRRRGEGDECRRCSRPPERQAQHVRHDHDVGLHGSVRLVRLGHRDHPARRDGRS